MYKIECDFLDYSIKKSFPDAINCEMSNFESAFLCGLIKKFRPKNIIEVGVASGGTSILILHTISKYKIDANLESYDLRDNYYRDKNKKTGFMVKEYFPDIKNYQIKTGNYLPILLENNNTIFDFIILDTVHSLPGELLDFLVLLQFSKPGTIFVLHDYHLYFHMQEFISRYSNKLLLDCIAAKKIFCFDPDYIGKLPNIGACIFNADTFKYVINPFSMLLMPWFYKIDSNAFNIYKDFYSKYYTKFLVELFTLAYENNNHYFPETKSDKTVNKAFALKVYNRLLQPNKYLSLKPHFDRNFNYCYYPINDRGTIHFEFEFRNNALFVSLHFESTEKELFDFGNDLISKSQLVQSLLPVKTHYSVGVAYKLDNFSQFDDAVYLMNYLIKISFPFLDKRNLIYYIKEN